MFSSGVLIIGTSSTANIKQFFCRNYGGKSTKNSPGWVKLALIFLSDPGHGPDGGFPLSIVTAMHNARPYPSFIYSRGNGSAILGHHSVICALLCNYLSGPNLLDFILMICSVGGLKMAQVDEL